MTGIPPKPSLLPSPQALPWPRATTLLGAASKKAGAKKDVVASEARAVIQITRMASIVLCIVLLLRGTQQTCFSSTAATHLKAYLFTHKEGDQKVHKTLL
jgi:hypothetical protein